MFQGRGGVNSLPLGKLSRQRLLNDALRLGNSIKIHPFN
jgi:hypothetical protein